MSMPTERLTDDERAELAYLTGAIEEEKPVLREAIAELILYRRLNMQIRRNRFLLNHHSVREIMERMPGSRGVPMAPLPTFSGRNRRTHPEGNVDPRES